MKRNRHIPINLFGILLALVIALGGALSVRIRLEQEQSRLLLSGGTVPVPVKTESPEGIFVDSEAIPANLTENELLTAVRDRERGKDTWLHEPEPGQLSMVQALEHGRAWIEDFLLPRLGTDDFRLQEYKANCHLWSLQEEETDKPSGGSVSDYWTVEIISSELEARLIVNASGGQILDASVSCSIPAEYQNQDNLVSLLTDYSASFNLEGNYFMISDGENSPEDQGQILYHSIGSLGLFAVLDTGSIVFTRTESLNNTDIMEYTELFHVHLYLRYGIPAP